MVGDKEGNILSNKKKRSLNIMKSTLNELQDGTDNDSGEQRTMCVQTAETYGEPPSDVDIEMAISKLKNRKATGRDQIPAELIKEGGKELKKVICEGKFKKKIWEEDITRYEWKYGIICQVIREGM